MASNRFGISVDLAGLVSITSSLHIPVTSRNQFDTILIKEGGFKHRNGFIHVEFSPETTIPDRRQSIQRGVWPFARGLGCRTGDDRAY